MLQLINNTPFNSQLIITSNLKGEDVALLSIKATFTILPKVTLAKAQVPIILTDEFLAAPEASSLLHACECLLMKPTQDLILNGTAWSPTGKPLSQFTCGMRINNFEKNISIFGDRYWHQGNISTAEPILSMPLIYENAYGGCHHFSPQLLLNEKSAVFCAKIPSGKVCGGKRNKKERENLLLPNLENPASLISSIKDKVSPWSLGFIAAHWSPRKEFCGTYDNHWLTQRSPFLPLDFDRRFFCTGSSGFNLPPGAITDKAQVTLTNLAEQNDIQFNLPECKLDVQITFNGKRSTADTFLETLLIEPDKNQFCLLWKSEINCYKKPLQLNEVSISLSPQANIAGLIKP